MEKTKVTYMDVDSLIPYANNPRLNDNAVDAVAASIKEFGFKVPIVVDGENVIINGHTRLKAAHKLGLKQVPVIVADDLTPEQVKAFRLADNKTGELAQWDMAKLGIELDGIEDIDMSDFGFDFEELEEDEPQADDTYTKKVNIPQYEPTGECPTIDELVDDSKANELAMRIQDSNVTPEEREFLIKAATRHYAFDYKKVAEYYANATPEMQELMEDSALVIIDVDDAIAKGYAKLAEDIEFISGDDDA